MALPPLFEMGVDPAQHHLSVTAFFTKKPPKALVAAAPAPFDARLEGNAIFGYTDEWPDAKVKRAYGTPPKRGGDDDDDDDEASDADWAKFFKATGAWLEACAAAGAPFALISADIECRGYAAALKKGNAQVFELIVPHLTKLLRAKVGDGVLFGNLAFSVALRLRRREDMSQAERLALIEMGEAAIEFSAHGDGTWHEIFEELMPSPRKKPTRRA
jgi:hypothetical protein